MNEKESLDNVIDLFTQHFIIYFNVPPLASKIYSFLLVSYRDEGIGFNEIMELTGASKSSVSSNLTFLKNNKIIHFYNEEGSKKTLYSPVSLGNLIARNLQVINSEKKATLEFKEHIKRYDSESYTNYKDVFFETYLRHIEKVNQVILETEKEFKELYLQYGRTQRQ